MKHYFVLLCLAIATLTLSSCAETNVSHIRDDDKTPVGFLFSKDYPQVWSATIQALSEQEIIKAIDEKTGFVVTEYGTVDKIELPLIKSGFLAKTYKYSYTVNLNSEGNNKTFVKIVVNLMAAQVIYQREEQLPWVESYLRKKLFTRICNKLLPNNAGNCNNMFSLSPDVLEAEVIKPTPTPALVQAPKTSKSLDPRLKKAQELLVAQGYDTGTPDGLMGKKTKTVLRQYQKDNLLAETGKLDDDTLELLGLIQKKSKKEAHESSSAKKDRVNQSNLQTVADELIASPANESVEPRKAVVSNEQKEKLPESASKLELPGEQKPEPAARRENTIVTGRGQITATTSLVSEASVMADSLGEIPKGASIEVLGEQNNFFKIRYNGKEGFVYSNFVTRK